MRCVVYMPHTWLSVNNSNKHQTRIKRYITLMKTGYEEFVFSVMRSVDLADSSEPEETFIVADVSGM